jgi:hypothetical protein
MDKCLRFLPIRGKNNGEFAGWARICEGESRAQCRQNLVFFLYSVHWDLETNRHDRFQTF